MEDDSNVVLANEAAKYEFRPGNGRDLLVALVDERVAGYVKSEKEVFAGVFLGRHIGDFYSRTAAQMAVLRAANRTPTAP